MVQPTTQPEQSVQTPAEEKHYCNLWHWHCWHNNQQFLWHVLDPEQCWNHAILG
ncbi:hypothetical protein [Nostoc sp.]|uniref:hypothetical protein n=1 Tax=Nostoc sp. TaxID=1180 RepID=UPI002FF80172